MLNAIIASWFGTLTWWVAFFIGFGVLAKLMPCNPNQPLLRKGMVTDALYGLVVPIIGRFVSLIYIGIAVGILFNDIPKESLGDFFKQGHGPLGALPLWAQAAMVFILSDFLLYWGHRLFHRADLWKWHAIHHSPTELDWLSTHRFHPVNVFLTFTLVDAFMLIIGFSMQAAAIMGTFNMLYSAMVHANLNWTFGPFKYVFASPVFHRWHHTTQAEGLDKNFAPTFPLIDIMFGTFYMPEGKLPERYGVDNAKIPESFIGQIIWPFKQR